MMMAKGKPAMSKDERAVYERLTGWSDRIRALMGLYASNGRLPPNKRDEAREMYREIKDGLHAEYKRGATQRGAAAQTEAARSWYQHTVHGAWTQLQAPVNSAPDKWFSELYAADIDFTHTLSQMRSVYDIPEE
jgi:hypothetical protein